MLEEITGLPQSNCNACRLNPQLRPRWGCDAEPAPKPVFSITCSRCAARPSAKDGCEDCGGTGIIERYRCPEHILGLSGARWVRDVVDTYVQYDTRSTLPVEGAWLDQSSSWCEAVAIIDMERGRYDAMRVDKMKRDREAAEARAKQRQIAKGGRPRG